MAVSHEQSTRLSEPLHRARALLSVGDTEGVHHALGEFDEAIETEGLRDDTFAASGWPLALEAWRRAGHPEEAIAWGSRWSLRARKHGWDAALSNVLCALGHCALDVNDLDRALRWFEEALAAARRDGDRAAMAAASVGEARAWEIRGEDDRCLSCAEQAETDARAAQDRLGIARALNVAARVRIRRGDRSAEAMLEEAEQLCVDAGDHAERLKVLLDGLPLAFEDEDLDRAEAMLDRAEEEATLIGGTELRARVALDRGELYRKRGRPEAARTQYRVASSLLPEGRPLLRIAKLNLALSDLEDGNLEALTQGLPDLLEATRGNRFLTGVTHLLGLAAGPADASDDEDEVWARHGTPARLALGSSRPDGDLQAIAARAARRMLKGADRIQAGRAALVMGLQEVADPDLIGHLRHSNAALPIGPYLTMQQLGVGGMGQVWLARHVDRDRPAAVKVLNPDQQDSAFAWDSLKTELRAISALSHPNIVRLLDHGRVGYAAGALSGGRIHPDSPYLALEFVPGGVLTPWMGKLSWTGVRNVLDDLLRALAHAHAHRVLHLDLKPENVLLADRTDPLGGVKLVDFGLALFRKASREIFAGTPQYMAPEQVQKGQEYGPWTDLYALGCLAWTLATGKAPFDHPDRAEMARLQAREAPPAFEPAMDVPAGFEGWLHRLLEKRVEDRVDRASQARAQLLDLERAPPRRTRASQASPIPDAGLALVQELEPELAGRERERDQLWSAFQRARRRTTLFELAGPLGSGRTALMTWLATQTHEEGLSEVQVHQIEQEPSAIWDRFRRRRRDRTALLLAEASEADGLLQALDEVDFPLLIVLRSTQKTTTQATYRVQLQQLAPDVMRDVLSSILPLSGRLEEALIGWASGNPGLAVQTLRALAAEGELRPTVDGWDVPHRRPFHVPRMIQDSLQSALAATTATRDEALDVCAALGHRFSGAQWLALAPAAAEVADALVSAAILGVEGEGPLANQQFRWIQPAAKLLLRDRPGTRLAHARIAEGLQEAGAPAHRVAEHFIAARRYAEAHRPLLDAVSASIEAEDDDEARRYLSLWEDALERLAVGEADPRRLAGKRLKARLED